ncbi:hypothetical protein [Shimia thalassica]|uniref:hypothetical protein n=1 Tax=Shimia thalassica TaxID=1715693 RepID=UPI0026E382E8|nr:hypothetical protein [Shimia thalassica]MDO6483579.1 hypothetical protein [Shimia thalassica]
MERLTYTFAFLLCAASAFAQVPDVFLDSRGGYLIAGSKVSKSCVAQKRYDSEQKDTVSLLVNWTARDDVFLEIDPKTVTGSAFRSRTLVFVFDDKTKIERKVKLGKGQFSLQIARKGKPEPLLETALKSSRLTVALPNDDAFKVDLSVAEKVQKGMEDCRKWIRNA